MDILGQSALLVGVTSFALGFSVLARNVRNKLYISFAVLTTLISGWGLCFFLERLQETGSFYRAHLLFNVWLGPAALAFIRLMLWCYYRLSRPICELSILLALGLTTALALRLDSIPGILQAVYFAPV